MRRQAIAPRPNWQRTVESQGMVYHTDTDGTPYWNESAYWEFTAAEVDELDDATAALYALCLQATEYVITQNRLGEMGVPEAAWGRLRESWDNREATLYGRFDLAYTGDGPPKMLEFNADTPTALVEAAIIQWHWRQDVFPDADQFNSLWEGFTQTWAYLRSAGRLRAEPVCFVSSPNDEDWMTIRFLRDTAEEAGVRTTELFMRDIGWDTRTDAFVDLANQPLRSIFKLYPWEWLLQDQFSRQALEFYPETQWIEPLWKMAMASKGLLPVLWELFPHHPNLAPAYRDSPRGLSEYVAKPIIGREGANITLHTRGGEAATGGQYGSYPRVYQERCRLPYSEGQYAVLGSWIVGGQPRGLGIRESPSPITESRCGFVPHVFV